MSSGSSGGELGQERWCRSRSPMKYRMSGVAVIGSLGAAETAEIRTRCGGTVSLSPYPPHHPSPPRSRPRPIAAGVAALLAAVSGVALVAGAAPAGAAPAGVATTSTTAWRNGAFNLDPLGVVSRDDVVMTRANTNP